MFTYVVSISTVRSVSGFAADVLKLGPLCTVNHCPFLRSAIQNCTYAGNVSLTSEQ